MTELLADRIAINAKLLGCFSLADAFYHQADDESAAFADMRTTGYLGRRHENGLASGLFLSVKVSSNNL